MASLEDLPDDVKGELALLARDLSENPATRQDFLRLTKKVRPNVPTPEIEIADAAAKTLSEANARVDSLEAKLRERDAKEELDKRRKKLVEDGKVKAEDIPNVEKVMLEQGITNHDTAADYWNWMNKAAAPTPGSSYSPNVFDQATRDRIKPFFANPQAAAREEGMKALADIRKGRVSLQ